MSNYKTLRMKANFEGYQFNDFKLFINSYSHKKFIYVNTKENNIKLRIGHIYLIDDEYKLNDYYSTFDYILDKKNLSDFLFLPI